MAGIAHLVAAVTASALAGHVSFLSSDLLEGRSTPSPGLEIAAQYIESQFRAAGLNPVVQQGTRGKNVLAVVHGIGPELRKTYIIVSAHYDHVGRKKNCTEGDCIFNGANDNASGVAAMLALAADIAKDPPKRSVLFAGWFGEELGFYGSDFYVANPLVPLENTVAVLNFEHMGRVDDSQAGKQLRRLRLTGFEYSDLGARLNAAAAKVGVEVAAPAEPNDYFMRSDNAPFAEKGIPAHTLGVAFLFGDYHAVGDEWHKLDYENMAMVTDAVGEGILALANDPTPPRWNTPGGVAPKLKRPDLAPPRAAAKRRTAPSRRAKAAAK